MIQNYESQSFSQKDLHALPLREAPRALVGDMHESQA